jgi:hypothetical protein
VEKEYADGEEKLKPNTHTQEKQNEKGPKNNPAARKAVSNERVCRKEHVRGKRTSHKQTGELQRAEERKKKSLCVIDKQEGCR